MVLVSHDDVPVSAAEIRTGRAPARFQAPDMEGPIATDASGRAVLPAGTSDATWVFVQKAGYAPAAGRIGALSVENGMHVVRLHRAFSATIRTLSRASTPLSGIKIAVSRGSLDVALEGRSEPSIGDRGIRIAETDAWGTARFEDLAAGEYDVRLVSDRIAPLELPRLNVPGEAVEIPCEFVYAAVLEVPSEVLHTSLTREGSHVGGVTMALCELAQSRMTARFPGTRVHAGVPGKHVEDGIGIAGRMTALFRMFTRRHGWVVREVDMLPEDAIRAPQVVTLPPPQPGVHAGELALSFREPNGELIVGIPCRVRLAKPRFFGDYTTIDVHSGEICVLAPGEYLVEARPPAIRRVTGPIAAVIVAGERVAVDRKLPFAVGQYQLSVKADGEPLSRAYVRFMHGDKAVGQKGTVPLAGETLWLPMSAGLRLEIGARGYRNYYVTPEGGSPSGPPLQIAVELPR